MKPNGNALHKITKALHTQEQLMPGVPVTELAGDRRVLIENHCGVTEYGSQRINVKVKFGQLIICGNELELAKMTSEQLVIIGSIDSIMLHRR